MTTGSRGTSDSFGLQGQKRKLDLEGQVKTLWTKSWGGNIMNKGAEGESLRAQCDGIMSQPPAQLPAELLRKTEMPGPNSVGSDSVLFGKPMTLMSGTESNFKTRVRPALHVRLDQMTRQQGLFQSNIRGSSFIKKFPRMGPMESSVSLLVPTPSTITLKRHQALGFIGK